MIKDEIEECHSIARYVEACASLQAMETWQKTALASMLFGNGLKQPPMHKCPKIRLVVDNTKSKTV